ncbi:hypothetical protein Cal7507_1714 [Calothrix sp. PCC 7507]|nr:hypothetical protein Cal7507_1714 [Calothrix sp. PCC 7507]
MYIGHSSLLFETLHANKWIKRTWVKYKAAVANGYATCMLTTHQGANDRYITCFGLFFTQGFLTCQQAVLASSS